MCVTTIWEKNEKKISLCRQLIPSSNIEIGLPEKQKSSFLL